MTKTLTLAQVAEILHLSKTQVTQLVRNGRIAAINTSTGTKRARFIFTEEAIKNFLSQTYEPPEKPVALKPYKRRWN
ncbi:helix-turn-helix domain-containing protein [Roseiconus lacunae]|uniref:helix-turn-helix domain-containing protein n=1 Tax=Roseiconus lacunae TaxID=2605694 RepID=UPI003089C8B8|nr:helix-turn-helix domain-containing protein [Stieleria sp. HD01]